MKIKVNSIVKDAVLKSQTTKTQIVKDLNKSRTWLDNVLEQEYMQVKYILEIGKSIKVDFTKLLPELNKTVSSLLFEEPEPAYGNKSTIDLHDRVIEIQQKYIALLEEHLKLLKVLNKQQ